MQILGKIDLLESRIGIKLVFDFLIYSLQTNLTLGIFQLLDV